jgi:hypothetical protein
MERGGVEELECRGCSFLGVRCGEGGEEERENAKPTKNVTK